MHTYTHAYIHKHTLYKHIYRAYTHTHTHINKCTHAHKHTNSQAHTLAPSTIHAAQDSANLQSHRQEAAVERGGADPEARGSAAEAQRLLETLKENMQQNEGKSEAPTSASEACPLSLRSEAPPLSLRSGARPLSLQGPPPQPPGPAP